MTKRQIAMTTVIPTASQTYSQRGKHWHEHETKEIIQTIIILYPSILHYSCCFCCCFCCCCCCRFCKSPHTVLAFFVLYFLFTPFPLEFLYDRFLLHHLYLPVRFCNTTDSLLLLCSTSPTLEHTNTHTQWEEEESYRQRKVYMYLLFVFFFLLFL